MAQMPSILGQNYPDAGLDTTLFTVGIGNQVQFSIFVSNHSSDYDRVTIYLLPNGGTEDPSRYIAFNTPVLGNAVMAFAGLNMNSEDRVVVKAENGTTSFVATGILTTP